MFLTVFLLPFIYLTGKSASADLTCPSGPIDTKTPVGKFPNSGLQLFPKDYACAVDFNIPNGWVIKFIVQTNITQNSADQLLIRDSISTLIEFSAPESVFYAPANKSRVWITTKTSTSSFFFSWQFIDVTTYKHNENPTGTIMKLDLMPLNYFVFTSATGPVTYHAASVNQQFDVPLGTIYVYDGSDLNARFIGSLLNLVNGDQPIKSSGKSLTLVNYYAYTTVSYGLANDFTAVSAFSNYTFLVLSNANQFLGNGNSLPSDTSATTFYCIDCVETHITSILIVNAGIEGQTVGFQPMTPSHNQAVVLSYDAKNNNNPYFPQQILSNTFTMIFSKCDVSIRLQPGPNSNWNKPFAGRKGTIASPSIWNPTTSSAYATNITSTDTFTYSFVVKSVVIATAGETLTVGIGSPDLSQPHTVEVVQTATNAGGLVMNGTYLSATFTGNTTASSFILTFDVENTTSTSPTTTTTAAPGLQTTTKSAPQMSISFASILILMKLASFTFD